jgi:hypothetical protein
VKTKKYLLTFKYFQNKPFYLRREMFAEAEVECDVMDKQAISKAKACLKRQANLPEDTPIFLVNSLELDNPTKQSRFNHEDLSAFDVYLKTLIQD